MKIKKIVINNFKSIEHLEYEFNDVILGLIGENGAGKSAFKEAIYASITGEFPDDCIKHGANFCSVGIELESGTFIERFIMKDKANKVKVDGKTSTLKVVNEIIYREAKIDKDVLKLVISPDPLLQLMPAEFSRFVTTYIPEKLNYDSFVTHLPSNLSVSAKDKLKSMLPTMPNTFDIQTLIKIHEKLVEERKFAKRELKILEAKIESFKGVQPIRTLEEIENEMNELLRKEGAQKTIKNSVIMYNNTVKSRAKIKENLILLKEQINNIQATKPDVEVLERIKTDKNNANKTITEAKSTISTLQQNNVLFQKTLDNLNTTVCPISKKIICTTDKSEMKEDLIEIIKQNNITIQKNRDIVDTYTEKLIDLEKEETTYRNNETAYNQKVILFNRYEAEKNTIPALPPKPEDVELVDYSTTIDALKKERDEFVIYQGYLKDIENQNKKLTQVEILETLCETLNPKGQVIDSVISSYLSIFTSTCNATAEKLRPNFEFKFIVDSGISYLIKPSVNKEFVPLDSLSSGEQLLALLILMDMFNTLTNSRIMLLDDLDKLDNNAFVELLNLIDTNTIKSKYDHIILCAVNHEDIVTAVEDKGIFNIYA
jgi:predicted outer membrane protein